jgi:copper homeostasis protein
MNPVKEVCVESFQETVAAIASGATRIELCEHLSCGGTTPSYGTIRQVIDKFDLPVMVMIRPRGGNFCYSQDEYEIMCHDIEICRHLNPTGVVFGLLNEDKTIDLERTAQLVNLARPMQVTFHKAIDESLDILMSVKQLRDIGVDRILTSGGEDTALQGSGMLQKMIEIAGDQLKIIVAGKVTWENFDEIRNLIPSSDYHGRRLVKF